MKKQIMKKKRTAAALLTFVMLLGTLAAGCSSDQGSSTSSGTSSGGSSTQSDTPQEDVTLTIMMDGISQMSGVQDDPVTKKVQEELGITMDIISTSGMDVTAELNALIASDDLPDVVVGITPEQRSLLIESSSIIPLDDLVDQYGEEVTNKEAGKKMLEYSRQYNSDGSGTLYFLGMCAGEDYDAGFPTLAPFIRWDVYQEIGSPKVEDFDALLDVLKQMQDAYPETEDGKKVYAISGCLADAGWNTYSLSAAEAFIGFRKVDKYGLAGVNTYDPTNYINAMADKDSPTWRLFRFFNKAYQMGILDPECATMKYDQWVEKINAGQVLYQPFNWLASENIMGDPDKVFLPVTFENFENDAFTCSYVYTSGAKQYAITSRCEHPERAMQLFNYAWSYEGAYTFVNGVQGEGWDYVDGEPQVLDSYVQGRNDGSIEAPLFSSFFGPFMNEDLNQPIALFRSTEYFQKYTCTDAVQEYCDFYDIDAPIENFNTAKYHTWDEGYEKILPAYTGELSDIDASVQDYVLVNLPKIVLAESDEEFEQMRESFMNDINAMGADKLIEERAQYYHDTVSGMLEIENAE